MGRKKLTLTSLFFKPSNNGGNGGDHTSATTPSSSSSACSSLSTSSSSWPWPSCKHPRTDSFRGQEHNIVYKTVNSVFFDSATDSLFTHSSEDCFSDTLSATGSDVDDYSEAVIRRGLAASSDRLLFEPGSNTSSILEEGEEEGKAAAMVPFKESVAMAMESEDPYGDFRRSMEEMVAAHGLRDWDCLEELLVWYLRVNGKKNHGFIVGAFVDLLVALASPAEAESETYEKDVAASASGSCSYSNLSSVSFEIEEVEEGSGSC